MRHAALEWQSSRTMAMSGRLSRERRRRRNKPAIATDKNQKARRDTLHVLLRGNILTVTECERAVAVAISGSSSQQH
jgi:hypothetical protein